jgi:putative ABC transport system permease protein
VESAAAASCLPSAGSCGDWWYSIADRPAPARGDVPISLFNTADAAYFRTMRIPILAGRGFTDTDRRGGPRVAVINEELARRWWTAPQSAVGQRIKVGGPYMEGPVYEIVGVAGNVSQMGLDSAPMPEIYFAFSQRAEPMTVVIRTAGEPAALAGSVRRQVAALDANVPVQSLDVFEKRLGTTLERRRFSTLLLGIFAALAIVLAAVGIYGVLDYWVGMRQKEIAIRVALGAQRAAILRWAGWHAARLAAFGIGLGAFGAWGAARWLKNLVFGVSERDPGMMLAAAAAVIGIAVLAAGVPLRRALRVDAAANLHDA